MILLHHQSLTAVTAAAATTCSVVTNPTPASDASCNTNQRLTNPVGTAMINRSPIPTSVSTPYVACRKRCINTAGCLSFAYCNDNRMCRLYKKKLVDVGFAQGKDPGVRKADLACFVTQCPAPLPPAVTPCSSTSTISATLRITTPTPAFDRSDDGSSNVAITAPFPLTFGHTTSNTMLVRSDGVGTPVVESWMVDG